MSSSILPVFPDLFSTLQVPYSQRPVVWTSHPPGRSRTPLTQLVFAAVHCRWRLSEHSSATNNTASSQLCLLLFMPLPLTNKCVRRGSEWKARSGKKLRQREGCSQVRGKSSQREVWVFRVSVIPLIYPHVPHKTKRPGLKVWNANLLPIPHHLLTIR